MHYALCTWPIQFAFTAVVGGQKSCSIRFMHYVAMHYEIFDCSMFLEGGP
jgi:hypothetical protein